MKYILIKNAYICILCFIGLQYNAYYNYSPILDQSDKQCAATRPDVSHRHPKKGIERKKMLEWVVLAIIFTLVIIVVMSSSSMEDESIRNNPLRGVTTVMTPITVELKNPPATTQQNPEYVPCDRADGTPGFLTNDGSCVPTTTLADGTMIGYSVFDDTNTNVTPSPAPFGYTACIQSNGLPGFQGPDGEDCKSTCTMEDGRTLGHAVNMAGRCLPDPAVGMGETLTSETWLDGKPIYHQWFYFPSAPNNGVTYLASANQLMVDNVIALHATTKALVNQPSVTAPTWIDTGKFLDVRYDVVNGLCVASNFDASSYSGYVSMTYTKLWH